MRRLTLAAVLLTACGGGDSTVNLPADAGLEAVQSIEVEVMTGVSDEQRWLTITQPLAAEIAGELDLDLELVEPRGCDATYEIRFFIAGGDPLALAYGCNGQPLLWGSQEFWDGRMAAAPQGFVDLLAVQISLLSQL